MTPEDELARVMAIGFPSTPARMVTCPQCNGACTIATAIPGEVVACATCHGTGTVALEAPIRPNV